MDAPQKMKIAVIVPSLANSGPVIVARDLVANLLDKVEKVDIFYFNPIIELDFAAPTHHLDFWQPIDFGRYQIIHSHGLLPDAYIFFNRSRIKCQTVSTIHNYVREDMHYHYGFSGILLALIWNLVLSRHNRIIALSRHMQNYYRRFLLNKNISYIYNGRNPPVSTVQVPDHCLGRLRELAGQFRLIGVVAILTRRKGIDQLIKVLPLKPDCFLVVVGRRVRSAAICNNWHWPMR